MKLLGFNLSRNQTPQQAESIMDSQTFEREHAYNFNPTYNLSNPEIVKGSGFWLPFGIDNLYPQFLLKMYNGSPFHSAIIDFKTKSVMGDGLEVIITPEGIGKVEATIQQKKLENKFNRKFFKRFVQEWIIHERVYIELKRTGDTMSLQRIIPAEFVRQSANDSHKVFYVNENWDRRGKWNKVAAYDKYNTKDEVQLLEFNEERPGYVGYAVPSYSTAANWIWLDSEIAFFQKQNIENSINPSAIIKLYEKASNEEENQKFVQGLRTHFSSAANSGKVLVFTSNGKELSPDITMAEPNKLDKSFAASQENIIRNVAYAHTINPVIMGISTAGKLGATSELNDAYELFRDIWLDNAQDTLQEYLNDILDALNIKGHVAIKRRPSFLKAAPAKKV